jgi:transposase
MRAYSEDIRTKVLEAYMRGDGSQREIAFRFSVSLSFVRDLLKLYRDSGSLEPRKKTTNGNLHAKIEGEDHELVRRLIAEEPPIPLSKLCERLASERNLLVSRSTMWRTIKREAQSETNRSMPGVNARDEFQNPLLPR